MTSSVKVSAHCSDVKEVVVSVVVGGLTVEQYVLQNGEVKELHVWDDRQILTMERLKPEVAKEE